MPQPFGHVVARLRRAAGLTQAALAQAVGTAQSTIQSLENDETQHPRLDTARKLAEALGIALRRLVVAWEGDDVRNDDLSMEEIEIALAYRRCSDTGRKEYARGALGLPPAGKEPAGKEKGA